MRALEGWRELDALGRCELCRAVEKFKGLECALVVLWRTRGNEVLQGVSGEGQRTYDVLARWERAWNKVSLSVEDQKKQGGGRGGQ